MTRWDRFVRDHHALVTGVALRVLGDSSAADDVAQDVFMRFFERPHLLDGVENVRGFLAQTAANRALDVRRERERRGRREAAFEVAPREADPVEAAWQSELREKVQELPAEERRVVDLRFYRGMTVREAAKEMRISTGTVVNRLGAALEKLRRLVGAASFLALMAVVDAVDADAEEIMPLDTPQALPDSSGPLAWVRGALSGAAIATVVATPLFAIWISRELPVPSGRTSQVAREVSPLEALPVKRAQKPAVREAASAPFRLPVSPVEGPKTVAQPAAAHEFVAEGFLVKVEGKAALAEPECTKRMAPRGKPILLVNGEELGGFAVSELDSFLPFLEHEAEASEAPQERVKASLSRSPDGVRFRQALERETLGTDWLVSWRDARSASDAIRSAMDAPPGPGRRAELVTHAEWMRDALDRAKRSRTGQHAPWRRNREMAVLLSAARGLQAAGATDLVDDTIRKVLEFEDAAERDRVLGGQVPGESVSNPCDASFEDLSGADRAFLGVRGGAFVMSPGIEGGPAFLRGDLVWRVSAAGGTTWLDVLDSAGLRTVLARARAAGTALRFKVLRGAEATELLWDPQLQK